MNDDDLLDTRDMVLHKNADGSMACGFKLDTILSNQDINGGGSKKNDLNIKDLGVPAGLLMIPKRVNRNYTEFTNGNNVIEDKLYDMLLSNAEDNPTKPKNTRKKKSSQMKQTKKKKK